MLKTPTVSILLPTFNQCSFLTERFESILQQTFVDWELIVVDSHSNDGAWELIQNFARQDQRIRISQTEQKGIYENWNNCLRLAKGNYIYIATSDDTMAPNCLEKMVVALEAYSYCDLCHSVLTAINEKGEKILGWWENNLPARFYEDWMDRPHIRYAPYDGILYCGISTVYIGIIQMMIRRSAFDKIGLFRPDWGGESDFEWGMRAALVCNTIHIPEKLAFWRIHGTQSTAKEAYKSAAQKERYLEMMQSAFQILRQYNPDLYQRLQPQRLEFIYRRQQLRATLQETSSWLQKCIYLYHLLWQQPQFIAQFIYRRLFFPRDQSDDFAYIRGELKRLGLENALQSVDSEVK
jgi:glycosyltransferase involved in cell wall biosynthesis